jgi:nucleoside phosphorylase
MVDEDKILPPSRFHYLLLMVNDTEETQAEDVFFPTGLSPDMCGTGYIEEILYKWRYLICSNGDCISLAFVCFINPGEGEVLMNLSKILKELRPYHILFIGVGGGVSREFKPLRQGDIVVSEYLHIGSVKDYLQADGSEIPILRPNQVIQPGMGLLTAARKTGKNGEWLNSINRELFPDEDQSPPIVYFGHYFTDGNITTPSRLKQSDIEAGEKDKCNLPPTWETDSNILVVVNQLPDVLMCDMESAAVGCVLMKLLNNYSSGNNWTADFLSIKAVSDIPIIASEWLTGYEGWIEHARKDVATSETNNAERKKWSKYAANCSATFAYHLINSHGKGFERQAHISRFTPDDWKDSIDYGCSGVIRAIGLREYSDIARHHLNRINFKNSAVHTGFFLMWPVDPFRLWKFLMDKYEDSRDLQKFIRSKQGMPSSELVNTYEFSELIRWIDIKYPHFKEFSDYASRARKARVSKKKFCRLLVLDDLRIWKNPKKRDHRWELIKKLNGSIDCWVGDKVAVKENSKILTDYVAFRDNTIMDYYEESSTLIINDLDNDSRDKFKFMSIYNKLYDKSKPTSFRKLDEFETKYNK